ncbi:ribonuclease R [Litoribrevibacter albus]|uniref:Ribonuclease R n=1 Tax=Litoribrevibacter albus TaxID=1473156 RepID=A0AA37W5L3_9GAMM|nr:ribonuclease R [Litoribrevibacter albus]GLQ30640.1 ribonuclease R [Litoribrevibacter albus]
MKDPFGQREADKYENPVPSRELITSFLEEAGKALTHSQLCSAMQIFDDERIEAMRRRLIAMSRDGQLITDKQQRYKPISAIPTIDGRVIGHRDGYGFVQPDDKSPDLYLNAREMNKVFDGDLVRVMVSGIDHKGRREARIIQVLEHKTVQLVGRYYAEGKGGFVVPDSRRMSQEVSVSPEADGGASSGQYVVVEIERQPSRREKASGRVIKILGDHLAPGMEIDVALHTYDVPHEWPEGVLSEVAHFTESVAEEDKTLRVDLRALPLVTIDGEDAKDFDDAVYCERKKSGGWRLIVAIADVSHYVKLRTELDKEAQNRATSVYFPGHVVPMLPEVLSNGLCSLNPNVDRLAMVCEMSISASGRMSRFKFYEAVIRSHARLTYNRVAALIEAPESKEAQHFKAEFPTIVPYVQELHRLYQQLVSCREERGAIDFDTTETRIVFSPDRKIETIVPVIRNDAHRVIEECMLCANVAAARFLRKHQLEGLYRVHEGPKEQKLINLKEFLFERSLMLEGGMKPTPGDYLQLAQDIEERPDRHLIQTMMLRSLSQAVYQPDNQGHFGLAYPEYTHFTSPIRRYPDLLVHRAIRSVLRSEKKEHKESSNVQRVPEAQILPREAIYPYDMAALLALGEQCSMAERRADEASRDVMAFLKCEYMQEHVGEVFPGIVSAVTGFGLFVELTDVYVEGLIHVSNLTKEYFEFDQSRHMLIGERSGTTYALGDAVDVRIVRVDLDERKIDLELVDHRQSVKTRRSKKKANLNESLGPKKKGRGKSGAKHRPTRESDASPKKKKSAKKSKRASVKTTSKARKKK